MTSQLYKWNIKEPHRSLDVKTYVKCVFRLHIDLYPGVVYLQGRARTKSVLLVISLAGIKVCSPDGKVSTKQININCLLSCSLSYHLLWNIRVCGCTHLSEILFRSVFHQNFSPFVLLLLRIVSNTDVK